MGLAKKKLTVNFPFAAHFNYFPLVWMIHRRFNNNRGKYLHKINPQLIYSDKTSSYEELLDKDESVSIHEGLLQVDCESGIKILSKSYFGRLSYKKQKIKDSFYKWHVILFFECKNNTKSFSCHPNVE